MTVLAVEKSLIIQRVKRGQGALRILIAFLCLPLMHCAPGMGITTQCILPSDQAKTIDEKWAAISIPLALQAGAFSSTEITAIQRAIKTWNQFASASFGKPLFNLQEGSNVRMTSVPRSTFSTCALPGFVSGSGYTAPIPIYRLTAGQWPAASPTSGSSASNSGGGSDTLIANTHHCSSSKRFFWAVIDLNFQDYFVSGKAVPDLESIVLHELGHLAGLDHSCENSSTPKDGSPTCSSNLPQTYLKAVMYPGYARNTSTGAYETRRLLNSNDQGRTNCLYGSN